MLEVMGEIATSNTQIILFFNSKSVRAKQILAFARAEGLPILEIDIKKKINLREFKLQNLLIDYI